jgi:hypothetical protein
MKIDIESIIGDQFYSVGSLLSLGMNFKLYGFSFKLLFFFLSWLDVGYLIVG